MLSGNPQMRGNIFFDDFRAMRRQAIPDQKNISTNMASQFFQKSQRTLLAYRAHEDADIQFGIIAFGRAGDDANNGAYAPTAG